MFLHLYLLTSGIFIPNGVFRYKNIPLLSTKLSDTDLTNFCKGQACRHYRSVNLKAKILKKIHLHAKHIHAPFVHVCPFHQI